ncbi:MAG: hypothetical protein U0T84_07960 [Chitinophagales bacterium]
MTITYCVYNVTILILVGFIIDRFCKIWSQKLKQAADLEIEKERSRHGDKLRDKHHEQERTMLILNKIFK